MAVQFAGGIENAQEIIRWTLGRGAPRYSKGTDTDPETMTFSGMVNFRRRAAVSGEISCFPSRAVFLDTVRTSRTSLMRHPSVRARAASSSAENSMALVGA